MGSIGTGNLGPKLKYYRERLGLTQTELARLSGVNREYISSMELGRTQVVYPDQFTPLQRVLRFPPCELVAAMGYPTSCAVDGLEPRLVQLLAEKSRPEQLAMADWLGSQPREVKRSQASEGLRLLF